MTAPRVVAAILAVCDQPRLTRTHIDKLVSMYGQQRRPVASRYAGGLGVPAVLDRADFPGLAALVGDGGARRLLAGAAAVDWPDGAWDVDTPAEADATIAACVERPRPG